MGKELIIENIVKYEAKIFILSSLWKFIFLTDKNAVAAMI